MGEAKRKRTSEASPEEIIPGKVEPLKTKIGNAMPSIMELLTGLLPGAGITLFITEQGSDGGDGFTFKEEVALCETKRLIYGAEGERSTYYMGADEFHTIRMHADQTILLLDQYEDVVPLDQPTVTFIKDRQAPSLDGLYEKFTEDEVLHLLQKLETQFGV